MISHIKLYSVFVLLSIGFGYGNCAPLGADSDATRLSLELTDLEMFTTPMSLALIETTTNDIFDTLKTTTQSPTIMSPKTVFQTESTVTVASSTDKPTASTMPKIDTSTSTSTTTTTTARPEVLPPAIIDGGLTRRYTEHHLEKSIEIDLYNPCQTTQEEFYIRDEIDKENSFHQNEHYDLEPDLGFIEQLAGKYITNPGSQEHKTYAQIVKRTRLSRGLDLLQDITFKVTALENIATEMIRKHMINECRTLDFPDIIHMQIPKDETTNSNLVMQLHNIYKTLVNQTAHLYFLHNQQNKAVKEGGDCVEGGLGHDTSKYLAGDYFHTALHAKELSKDFFFIGQSLRSVMCKFQHTFVTFDKPVDTRKIVAEVLTHKVRLSTVCARMQVVDCQLMRNSVRIFSDIGKFLRDHSHRLFNELVHKSSRTLKF